MTQLATFGAGCFWGVQHHFDHLPGVIRSFVGYMGGTNANPTYKEVCTGATYHAEVVHLEFDPEVVSFAEVVAEFWRIHDPTTKDRQGPDWGTQYRSVIFCHSPEQEEIATASMAEYQPRFPRKIVTQIVPAETFWMAEDYHQKYFEGRGSENCHLPNWPRA